MPVIKLIMPKMGESVIEATILKWVKNVGDSVEMDETILEIATDKVDTEVPSPEEGVLTEIFFQEGETVAVGAVLAMISTEGEVVVSTPSPKSSLNTIVKELPASKNGVHTPILTDTITDTAVDASRFYSPLVKSIAKAENIRMAELEQLTGTGKDGRVTKKDILAYVENRHTQQSIAVATSAPAPKSTPNQAPTPLSRPSYTPPKYNAPAVSVSGNVEIVEMDRMRKLIAEHMVMSKHVSPHVTSFVEADVTNIVKWRNRIKADFKSRYGEKITYTPIFIEAVVKALVEFPRVNVSVKGSQIIVKKDFNIGMAAALPSGNLIVPVIHGADMLNLVGLTKKVNDLASRARANKLKPADIQGGTFTMTNVGTFGNVMGTPIINQPQAAILAVGAIRKKPAVVETEYGDLIAVRHMMFLSLSYDHRVVDGALGGSFLKRIADNLEAFDSNRTF